jgi:hypothetical protein
MKLYAVTESIPYETYHMLMDMDINELALQNRLATQMLEMIADGYISPETRIDLWEKDMANGDMKRLRSWEWRGDKWNNVK